MKNGVERLEEIEEVGKEEICGNKTRSVKYKNSSDIKKHAQ